MNTRKLIVIGLLASCVVAGAGVAYQPPLGVVSAQATIPPARYQVIADMLTMEQQIADLQRDLTETRDDLREVQGRIGAMLLLRARDVEAWQSARAEDQKRLASLEWNARRPWSMCR